MRCRNEFEKMDEIFRETFSALKLKLKSNEKKISSSTKYVSDSHFTPNQTIDPLATTVIDNHSYEENNEIRKKLKNLRKLRAEVTKKLVRSSEVGQNIHDVIENHYSLSKNLSNRHQQYAFKQLLTQNSIAERRLRELVFEIIGEYGKSLIRAKRRQLHLRLSNRIDQVVSISQLRWKLFIQRLIYEAFYPLEESLLIQQLSQSSHLFSIMNPSEHFEEYSYISTSLCRITSDIDSTSRDESNDSSSVIVCWAIKINPNGAADGISFSKKNKIDQHQPNLRPVSRLNRGTSDDSFLQSQGQGQGQGQGQFQSQPALTSIPYLVADTLQDMKELISTLRELICPSKILSNQSTTRPRSTGMKNSNSSRPTSGNQTRGLSKSISSSKIPPVSSIGSYQLVSNHYIEWMKPGSYHTISSKILSLHFKSLPLTPSLNQFDRFARQYVTQFMTTTYSQRVYFCLEERFASGISADDLIQSNNQNNGSTPSAAASSGNTTPKSIDSRVLQALKYLQIHYCSQLIHSSSSSSSNSASASNSYDRNGSGSLSFIRQQLSEDGPGALRVIEQLSSHRTPPVRNTMVPYAADILSTFPNILKIRNVVNNQVFHLAPMTILNFVETTAFNNPSLGSGAISSDQMRVIGMRCPHPLLPLLCSSTSPSPLQSLYFIALLSPQTTNFTQEQPLQVTLPLPLPCVRELLRLYLWPHVTGTSPVPSSPLLQDMAIDSNIGTIPTHLSSTVSCLDLLPDDPVSRVTSSPFENKSTPRKGSIGTKTSSHSSPTTNTTTTTATTTNTTATTTGSNSNLRYRYAIIRSDYVDTSLPSLSYYFIQFRSKDMSIDQSIHPDLMMDNIQTNPSSTTSATPTNTTILDDYLLFEQILKGYRDGLLKSFVKTPSKQSESGTELSILSTICRWRSCLSESCQESNNKYLCLYHHHLKKYLDEEYATQQQQQKEKSNTSLTIKESSKYLPKKINYHNLLNSSSTPLTRGGGGGGGRVFDFNNQVDRDLLLITSSCTLIHELWDGKLQLTLTTFANKICYELNSKKRILLYLQHNISPTHTAMSSSSSLFTSLLSYLRRQCKNIHQFIQSPGWVRWKNSQEYHRVTSIYQICSQLLHRILHQEREITTELHLLTKMKIFPSAELIIIKKEMKLHREKYQNVENNETSGGGSSAGTGTGTGTGVGDADNEPINELIFDQQQLEQELNLTERKFQIIRGRRVDEEEARSVQKKRIAKARQIDEIQSKDPLNFRNQTRF